MSEQEQLDRKARFLKSQEERKKAEKEKGGYGSPLDIPAFEYLLLKKDKCQVVRLLGESLEMRSKPTDPLLIERSIIRADDGSYFTMIWHPEKDHPFRILTRKLCKYKYEGKGKEAKKIYDNAGCPLLTRYNTNGKENPNMYETGMNPSKYVLFNAIDRMDTWCVDNKHTKMLAWDVNEKDGKTFHTPGMSYGLYKEIFDKKCSMIGAHYEDVDLVIRRFSEHAKPSEDMYYVVMSDEEKRSIQTWADKDKVDYLSFINSEETLSSDEKAYERYNLDNIPFTSQPTPIAIIMNKLGKFIKAIDEKYGWNLWELFVEWKAVEMEQLRHRKEASEKESTEQAGTTTAKVEESSKDELPSTVEEKPVVVKSKVSKAPVVKAPAGVVFTEEDYNTFEGLQNLPEEYKKHITKVDSNEMLIEFDEVADVQCATCEQMLPDSFDYCPYCGQDYRA